MSRAPRTRAEDSSPHRARSGGGVDRAALHAAAPDVLAATVPAAEHWVSTAALRQSIGGWAYTLSGGEPRPGNDSVRAAIAVASAIRELALDPERRRWSQGGELPLEVAVPEDQGELAARSGYPLGEVERALDLLTAARTVTRQRGAGGATVTLAGAMLSPMPAVARLAWPAVRDRLHAVGGSLPASQAVLRELAVMAGAIDVAGPTPTVRASVRDLEDSTAFGRSTVSEALASLERARLVDVETRAGRVTRFTIRRAALGQPDDEPAVVAPRGGAHVGSARGAVSATSSAGARDARVVESRGTSGALSAPVPTSSRATVEVPRVVPAGAPVMLGEFGGTPIYGPPGTPLIVECDAEGRWTCRVGPFLRLGPVGPAE